MAEKVKRPPARTLRWLKYDQHMTQAHIAKRYGVAPSTVSKWFSEIDGDACNSDTSVPRLVVVSTKH